MKSASLIKILILLLLYTSISISQSIGVISGRVIDKRTKEPLVGVNVLVLDTKLGSSTDENGQYRIDDVPVGTYRLEFEYIGYQTLLKTDIVVKPSKPAIVNAELRESAIQGEEVTVTAGYFIEEQMTQPSTLGLSREEIRRFPGGFEDVVRTVSTLPGVAINTGGGRNDLLVRGGGPSENLYVINNIVVPNINHFSTQGTSSGSLSFINLDFVDNVSFSTGSFKARYGDKMSSVLNLTMAEGRSDRLGSKFMISATQFGLNLEGPVLENGNFIFSARRSYLDFIFRAAGLSFVPEYTDFNFLMHYDLTPNDKIFLLGLAAIDRVDRDLGTPEDRVDNASLMDNTQNQFITGVNYRHLMKHGYVDLTLNSNLYQYRFNQINKEGEEYFSSESDEQEFNIKLQHYWSISKSIGLLSGLSVKNIINDNSTSFADTIYNRSGNKVPASQLGYDQNVSENATARQFATFMELEWIPISTLTTNIGFRADYYTFINNSLYLAPRLSLKYKPFDQHSFRLSGGYYYQSPSYVWTVNEFNKNLNAMQNRMGVLGWDYLIRKDFRFSVEGYYKDYSDLPTGTIPGETDYIVQTNIGTGFGGREDDFRSFGYFDMVSEAKGEAYGVEILLQKKFSDIPCYGLVSLTYGKSEYVAGNGKTYPGQFDQRFIFNLSGGYIFNSKWEISAKFRYFTGVPFTPVYHPSENPINPGSIQNLPEEYLSDRLNPGHHFDIRVDRYFNFKNWTLIAFIDIQNIYNYQIPQRPRYDFWEDEIIKSDAIAILPSIGISAEF